MFNVHATFMSYVMLSEKHSMATKYSSSVTSPCIGVMLCDSRNAQWTSHSNYEGSFWEITVQLPNWITSENGVDSKRKFYSSVSAYDLFQIFESYFRYLKDNGSVYVWGTGSLPYVGGNVTGLSTEKVNYIISSNRALNFFPVDI